MADTKPTDVPSKPVELDWKLATEHLQAIKNKVMEYKGKTGYNPFLWWRDTGAQELEEKLLAGIKLPDIHSKIMSLKFAPPVAKGCKPDAKPAKT